jgi:hypothetical protein
MARHALRFGEENSRRYIGVSQGSANPIYLHHPQTKRRKISPIQYEPDVYYTTKKKNKIVFEILESEYRKTSEVISDMIQCCLCSDVVRLIFIIPVRDREVENRIFDTYNDIAGTLITMGVSEHWIPDMTVYFVSRRESVSYLRTKRIFARLSKQDRW